MKLLTVAGLCVAGVIVAACGKKDDPTPDAVLLPAPASATATAPVPARPAPVAAADPAAAAPAAPAVAAAPAASSDPDAPTALPSKQLKGVGIKKSVSYYYALNAGAGQVKIVATAKNAPSGATSALTAALYDTKANRLCYDTHGNTTSNKTVTINCSIEKAQPLILRLDLGEETIDYSVALEGPVELPPPEAAGAAKTVAGAGSIDIDEPTRLETNRIKGEGPKKATSYYYAFNAGPGELTVTGDGKNVSAATTEALQVSLLTRRSEKLCDLALGNTTLDKRVVTGCKFDKRTPVILRVDLSPETVDYRVRFDGPHDFDPYTAPKEVTIALDAAVLFDTGKADLKPEAKQTLREAAERVKKFKGASVTISGHTDNVGNEASNKTLSEKRAAAVKAYFVSTEAVPADGLSVKGFGKSQPVADNGSEQGRARNRRVDVVIKPAAQ
jgi:outer membrane protein OmpA-like peptidoglycan-associated protein